MLLFVLGKCRSVPLPFYVCIHFTGMCTRQEVEGRKGRRSSYQNKREDTHRKLLRAIIYTKFLLLSTFSSRRSLSTFFPEIIFIVGKRSAANLHIGPTPRKRSCSSEGIGYCPWFDTIPATDHTHLKFYSLSFF